ncbi:hypothetical protein Q0590_33825 [Rhodocytophaga aerolata]|uniref:Uncharacterized protein n=1 Tax=Rhodocytophaga aerolata TaxID=455078 RepID=A0ABT8RJ92_9BACT|nr:hypothetical protein [Rhodocytophaga aerolata]MDO1451303.1 hypothetical protein [Rhodocytophaga aerolata]
MAKITKEDVQKAFLNKSKKRNNLLYEYYREEYFTGAYTAKFIAEKISEDLGLPISEMMIFLIKTRIINKQKAALPSQVVTPPPAVDTFSSQQVIKEEKTEDTEKVQPIAEKKYEWSDNRKDLKKNEFMDAYLEREERMKKRKEEEKRQEEEKKKNQDG